MTSPLLQRVSARQNSVANCTEYKNESMKPADIHHCGTKLKLSHKECQKNDDQRSIPPVGSCDIGAANHEKENEAPENNPPRIADSIGVEKVAHVKSYGMGFHIIDENNSAGESTWGRGKAADPIPVISDSEIRIHEGNEQIEESFRTMRPPNVVRSQCSEVEVEPVTSLAVTNNDRGESFEDEYDYENENSDEDDEDEDDYSESSGGTVVAYDHKPPPTDATKEELARYYWEWCYGPVLPLSNDVPTEVKKKEPAVGLNYADGTWSAMRSAPSRSCLSTRKRPSSERNDPASTTPFFVRRILQPSPVFENEISDVSLLSTPTDDENRISMTRTRNRINSAVKFGSNSAVEFDFEQPITNITPIPPNLVQKIFPNEKVETEKEIEEQEVSRETAKNVAILAEWDDDFDSILCQDDSDEESEPEKNRSNKRGRRKTPAKKGRRSIAVRPQKRMGVWGRGRRESTIFSGERKSLLDDCDDDCNHDDESGLPFSVTIDPAKYTSPSSVPSEVSGNSECVELQTGIETPEGRSNTRKSIDSFTSVCVSPSSFKSESSTALENTGKETPTSARTSSSTILRAVHASGALLPLSSPQAATTGDLRPNQLKYSPSTSTERSDTSMFTASSSDYDNMSLESDIMNLYGQHNIDDDDSSIFLRQLSMISNHPSRILHIDLCDLVLWIEACGRDASDFIDDEICNRPSKSSLFSLLFKRDEWKSILFGEPEWPLPFIFASNHLNEANELRIQKYFEYILSSEAMKAINHPSRQYCSRDAIGIDGESLSIISCLKQLVEITSFHWRNSELSVAELSSRKLYDWAEQASLMASADGEFVDSCRAKLLDTTSIVANELARSKPNARESPLSHLRRRKRKAMHQIEKDIEEICLLEEDLKAKVARLNRSKRVKRFLWANLEMEKVNPIAPISEEIRGYIFPAPVTTNASDFTFSLLDGAAEVAIKIFDDENNKTVDIGCFIKDGGVSIQFLRAFLLGNVTEDTHETNGPFPLRSSLTSLILREAVREDMVMQATHLIFRINALLFSVRKFERESVCAINLHGGRHLKLCVSMHREGLVIQLHFLFRNLLSNDWIMTTVPSDVEAHIISAEEEFKCQAAQMQCAARDLLSHSSSCDPTLLTRICDHILEMSTVPGELKRRQT